MKVIENKRLSSLMTEKIVVNANNGDILLVKNNEHIDITDDILEFVVLAVEGSKTFSLWNRNIRITIEDTELLDE